MKQKDTKHKRNLMEEQQIFTPTEGPILIGGIAMFRIEIEWGNLKKKQRKESQKVLWEGVEGGPEVTDLR